ncbi:G-protein coupled receptor Mth2-like [Nylanderia fulva]|uniref:G-protein coupled receptor Mth2-like n=1 Tax=Nylanderia fulva TaxID=613905 RepID=UPI0010FB1F8C|nr:G-protein coupled receptor Mth2-like [Nylanderia fulva]
MYGKNFVFVCCGVLLVTALSKSRKDFTKIEGKYDNLTVQYKIDTESTTNYIKIETLQYDVYEKLTNNEYVNSKRYKLETHFVHNHENDEEIPIKSHTNSTNVSHQRNFMSQEVYENSIENNDFMSHEVFENCSKNSNEGNIVPYEMCHNITCFLLCCPLGENMRMVDGKCISEEIKYVFPKVYEYINDSIQSKNKRVDELFQLAIHDSCHEKNHFQLPDYHRDFIIFVNGSIYLSYYKIFVKSTSYCLTVVEGGDKFDVVLCSETLDEINKQIIMSTDNTLSNAPFVLQVIYLNFCSIVSILFLVAIFLVYSILPELQNVYGFMLRNYSATLSVSYTFHIVNNMIKADYIPYPICIAIAFFIYFFSLSNFFWLITISFHIWWTFRGFCSLHNNVKKLEKRKLFYAIFAWGCPFILAIVYAIMDSVSEYVPNILRLNFYLGNCWFYNKEAFLLYYYVFKSICISCSISLSIFTALKMKRYEKDTNFCLTDSESKRYKDNKKWLNLYLKLFILLFIVIGIKWFVMTVTWLSKNVPNYVWYVTGLVNILQNLCTLIIFVWRKKIKVILLKRLEVETNSKMSSTTTSWVSMKEKTSSCGQVNCHAKGSSDETEL